MSRRRNDSLTLQLRRVICSFGATLLGMTNKAYAVVGITEEEFIHSDDMPLRVIHDVMDAVRTACATSMKNIKDMHARGVRIGHADMMVYSRDAISDGPLEGFESYVSLLFINKAAQAACNLAGVPLKVIDQIDDDRLPPQVGLLVRMPLYVEGPR